MRFTVQGTNFYSKNRIRFIYSAYFIGYLLVFVLFGSMLFKMIFPVVLNKTARESSYCGFRAAFLCLNVTAVLP